MKFLNDLENSFNLAKEGNFKYIGVLISMEGFEKPELIINRKENFDTKLAYYKKAYNNDLTLKTFSGIKIIDFAYGNNLDTITLLLNKEGK